MSPARVQVVKLLSRQEQPTTVAAVAAFLGGHANRARAHLQALVDLGWVQRAALPTRDRGRPKQGYQLTMTGRAAAQATGWESALVAAFFSQLVRRPEATTAAREVGMAWADSLEPIVAIQRPAVEGVLDALEFLGFSPVVERHSKARSAIAAGEKPVETQTIVLRTCPLVALAREDPQVVCQVHQGLVTRLTQSLDSIGEATTPTLRPFARPHACELLL